MSVLILCVDYAEQQIVMERMWRGDVLTRTVSPDCVSNPRRQD